MNKDNIKTMTKADVGELKSGDIVYIRMRASSFYGKEFDSDIGFLLDFPGCCGGTEHRMSKRWLHKSIMREIGIENTETAPKYDPSRPFRKGDMVKLRREHASRDITEFIEAAGFSCEKIYRVETGENYKYTVKILNDLGEMKNVDWCYLELVTPVEELEPYSVTYSTDTSEECGRFEVVRGEQCVSIYPYGTHETRYYKKAEHAKAAAEAERDRLNAEYRKEQK